MNKVCLLLSIGMLVCSCKTNNVIAPSPTAVHLSRLQRDDTFFVFADQVGCVYPKMEDKAEYLRDYNKFKKINKFKQICKRFWWKPIALNSRWPDYNLKEVESTLSKDLGEWVNNFDEVAVLVHGFNNDFSDIVEPYTEMIRIISNSKPTDKKIGFVLFSWDGLKGKGPGIWGEAQDNSLLVGQRAFRLVMNIASQKPTLVISHSRGGAVVLASLDNPSFMEKNEEILSDALERVCSILDLNLANINDFSYDNQINGDQVTAYLIAPAIGTYSFMSVRNCNTNGDIRKFSENIVIDLKGADITLCPSKNDKVLKKVIDMPGQFGSTLVGANPNITEVLSRKINHIYTKNNSLRGTAKVIDFSIVSEGGIGESHSFTNYVKSVEFEMLMADYFNEKK